MPMRERMSVWADVRGYAGGQARENARAVECAD